MNFTERIRVQGKHARIIKKYSRDKQAEEKVDFKINDVDNVGQIKYFFDTMLDFVMVAMTIGLIEDRTAEEDNDSQITPVNIFSEIIIKKSGFLDRIMYHMVLSDKSVSLDSRIKKAFGIMDDIEKKKTWDKMLSYMRGGLEIFEDFFSECKTYEDTLFKILELRKKYCLSD